MRNLSLLREAIRLMLEADPAPEQKPFVIRGSVTKAKSSYSTYAIYREFPVVMPPEMMAAIHVGPEELENGAVTSEHEIIIDVDVHFQRSRFKGSRLEPADPDEWEVQGWQVEAIDGFALSAEDASALKAYLGDLTDDEVDKIHDTWRDAGNDEPDYPEWDDRDDFIDD